MAEIDMKTAMNISGDEEDQRIIAITQIALNFMRTCAQQDIPPETTITAILSAIAAMGQKLGHPKEVAAAMRKWVEHLEQPGGGPPVIEEGPAVVIGDVRSLPEGIPIETIEAPEMSSEEAQKVMECIEKGHIVFPREIQGQMQDKGLKKADIIQMLREKAKTKLS